MSRRSPRPLVGHRGQAAAFTTVRVGWTSHLFGCGVHGVVRAQAAQSNGRPSERDHDGTRARLDHVLDDHHAAGYERQPRRDEDRPRRPCPKASHPLLLRPAGRGERGRLVPVWPADQEAPTSKARGGSGGSSSKRRLVLSGTPTCRRSWTGSALVAGHLRRGHHHRLDHPQGFSGRVRPPALRCRLPGAYRGRRRSDPFAYPSVTAHSIDQRRQSGCKAGWAFPAA